MLLSSTLRPHGHGTNPRPIFAGSNDRAYKVLAQWANHLSAPKDGAEAASKGALPEVSEVFAVDRNRIGAAQPMKSAAGGRRSTLEAGILAGHGWPGDQSRPVRSPGIPDPVCRFPA